MTSLRYPRAARARCAIASRVNTGFCSTGRHNRASEDSKMAGYDDTCLSSTPFSIDPDSLEEEDTPVMGSPAVSVTPSSRGSRSYEAVSKTPVRQVISPPPFWCPSPWSPSHSVPDLRRAAAGAAMATPYSSHLAATGPVAAGQARAKSPFWVASPDNVQPQGQTQYGISALDGAAGGQQQQQQQHPPGSGDRQDRAIRNREATARAVAARWARGGWCPWWCWAPAPASCCWPWPPWAPLTRTAPSSRESRLDCSPN
ncbi:uncharacterized protein LOC144125238 isoform X2 [Amblyomma americanum]